MNKLRLLPISMCTIIVLSVSNVAVVAAEGETPREQAPHTELLNEQHQEQQQQGTAPEADTVDAAKSDSAPRADLEPVTKAASETAVDASVAAGTAGLASPGARVGTDTVAASAEVAPLSIQDCVAYAVEHRPDIQYSRIDVARAQWRVITQKAKYAFNLSASASHNLDTDADGHSVTLERALPMDFDVRATVSQDDGGNEGTASLRISKVILGGGSLVESNQGINDSLINELIAQNNHLQKVNQLNLLITSAYYQVVRSKQTLAIQLRQLEHAKTNRERAVDRDRLLDIANADIQVSENEDRVLQAKLAIVSARDSLKQDIGMPITEQMAVIDKFQLTFVKHNLEKDWAYAQKNHVDFVNLNLEIQKIDRDIRVQRSQILPTVGVNYNVSRDSSAHYNLDGETNSSVGVSLNWQFGASEDRSAYHQALLRKEESTVQFYALTQDKLTELRDLDRQLFESVQRIHLAEERLKLQERSTALYADRWENGEIDILEYIRNQDALENSRVDLLRLKIEYIEKLERYRFAVGRY